MKKRWMLASSAFAIAISTHANAQGNSAPSQEQHPIVAEMGNPCAPFGYLKQNWWGEPFEEGVVAMTRPFWCDETIAEQEVPYQSSGIPMYAAPTPQSYSADGLMTVDEISIRLRKLETRVEKIDGKTPWTPTE